MKTIFIFILVLIPINHAWNIQFKQNNYTIHMDEQIQIAFNITDDFGLTGQVSLEILAENEEIIALDEDSTPKVTINNISIENGFGNGTFVVHGLFLGRTRLILTASQVEDGQSEELPPLKVKVIRKVRTVDRIFNGSVGILVALIYINFGCALDWTSLKSILRRPVGPLIGFFGQFGVMPVLAYLIGLLVFAGYPEMRLGLFFTGVSPAGGASNVWTVILEGNLDLSVTMTTISTLAAFFMIPLWMFTLGPVIFAEAKLGVPYEHIAYLAAALIIPLIIGWSIQRFLPRLSKMLVRVLKGFSALLILFIVVFAIATNMYLFRLATWRIVAGGMLLPWCGFVLGGIVALLFKQTVGDVTAISIETGVQNTGIAIFLLRFSLPEPEGDLTTVVPVAIACMTPLPLTMLFIYKKFIRRNKDAHSFVDVMT